MTPPSLGRIVIYRDGVSPYPAIVTRVWSEECVNLTVFTDAGCVHYASVVRGDDLGNWNWPVIVRAEGG